MTSQTKVSCILISILLLGFSSYLTYGQGAEDDEIRRLEQVQARAIIENDTTKLDEIWGASFIVNSPNNVVLDRQMALAKIKKGNIHYLSYETQIENISFVDSVAIVMGQEIVQPVGQTNHAGKTVKRRYTNVWLKTPEGWQLTAQQATTISVQ